MKVPYYYSIFQKKYKAGPARKDGNDFVNLTSLLDVLIILLFFLLMSYNPTEFEINADKDINTPFSESLDFGKLATVVQVKPNLDIFLEKEKIGNLSSDDDIAMMQSKFASAFESQKQKFASKKIDPKNVANINFIMDGKVQYEYMEKIMLVAAQSGFENYKFIVRSKPKK